MSARAIGMLTAAVALVAAAGCSSSDRDTRSGRTYDTRDTYRSTRYDDRYDRDRYNDDRYGDRYGDRDVRVSSSRLDTGSRLVKEGRGEMSFLADRSGEVKAYDTDDDRMVYSGHLHRGERFTLNPDGNRAEVNGRTVLQQDLKRDHRFEIRFQPD